MTYYASGTSGDLDQGDILAPMQLKQYLPWWPDDARRPLVIVTPTCDLAQERAQYHRLCVLQPLPVLLYWVGKQLDLLQGHWDGKLPVGKNKWQSIRQKLKNTITNAWPRYHFLPSEQGIFETDYFVDFELLLTIPLTDLRIDKRHTRLTSPYKEELIQRLTAHMMRIGTPNFSSQYIESVIDGCISSTKLHPQS